MNSEQWQFFFRWFHVIAGITWIGMLYFFNFINVPLQAALDDQTKKSANPQLMPRALWWFRWGAMMTLLAGLALFVIIYMYTPGIGWGVNPLYESAGGLTTRGRWITLGMAFGCIMWFNVWFIIWPAQKKLLRGLVPAEQIPAVRKRAGFFSRVNTYLSGPMLFGMLGANHFSSASAKSLIAALAVGFAAIWIAIRHAAKVGKSA